MDNHQVIEEVQLLINHYLMPIVPIKTKEQDFIIIVNRFLPDMFYQQKQEMIMFLLVLLEIQYKFPY